MRAEQDAFECIQILGFLFHLSPAEQTVMMELTRSFCLTKLLLLYKTGGSLLSLHVSLQAKLWHFEKYSLICQIPDLN